MATSRKTKEEQVAEFLREAIIAGRFPRGARLKQVEIARMLDTSATPVREALRLLEAEGYVLASSHKGVTVAPLDIEASGEILDLRVRLECDLVLAAMDRLQPADAEALLALQKEVEDAVESNDRDRVRRANYRFHRHLYELAGRPQTLRFVQILWAKYPFDLINRIDGRIGRTAQEHAALLEAVFSGDRVAAMAATRRHVEAGWHELQAALAASASEPKKTGASEPRKASAVEAKTNGAEE